MTAKHTPHFPRELYLSDEVRKLDRIAIDEFGIPSFELMEKAARFAFHTLINEHHKVAHLTILCGAGNNAGDGYLLAAISAKRNISCTCFALTPPKQLSGDARRAYDKCKGVVKDDCPLQIDDYSPEAFKSHLDAYECSNNADKHIVVDAMLGTGLKRSVEGNYAKAIEQCNASSLFVLSMDLPSGLSADTGKPMGAATKADATTTFIGNKLGLMTGEGRKFSGEILFGDLGVQQEIRDRVPASLSCLNIHYLLKALPKRAEDCHKGNLGHALLVGGDHGLGGAIVLATRACTRVGCGLVSVASRSEHCASILNTRPEAMAHAVEDIGALNALLGKASVVGIGPGLGQKEWALSMLAQALETDLFLVIDADALNLIAHNPPLREKLILRGGRHLLTPHPAEAARLLACETTEIEQDRFQAVKALQSTFGGHALLKGSGTLIAHPSNSENQQYTLCPYGNPGMASGGMGDVLTGILAGIVAQYLDKAPIDRIINLAVCLHAYAADIEASENGGIGMLASDLPDRVRALLNQIV